MSTTKHDTAVDAALKTIEPINAEMRRMNARISNETALAYAAGRYRWPEMDRLMAEKNDRFLEAALRGGADPSRLGPRADVDYIQRHIAEAP